MLTSGAAGERDTVSNGAKAKEGGVLNVVADVSLSSCSKWPRRLDTACFQGRPTLRMEFSTGAS